jgi:hypothetical protein
VAAVPVSFHLLILRHPAWGVNSEATGCLLGGVHSTERDNQRKQRGGNQWIEVKNNE